MRRALVLLCLALAACSASSAKEDPQSRISELESQIQAQEDEIEDLKTKVGELEEARSTTKEDIETLDGEVDQLKQRLGM